VAAFRTDKSRSPKASASAATARYSSGVACPHTAQSFRREFPDVLVLGPFQRVNCSMEVHGYHGPGRNSPDEAGAPERNSARSTPSPCSPATTSRSGVVVVGTRLRGRPPRQPCLCGECRVDNACESKAMTLSQVVIRVKALEQAVRRLGRCKPSEGSVEGKWYRTHAGRFAADPEFEQIVKLGQAYRKSLRPAASSKR
jgi:hypothetical protein